jgi:hypothetical protein
MVIVSKELVASTFRVKLVLGLDGHVYKYSL